MALVKRARGAVALLRDGVLHGSRAIEKVGDRYRDRTYAILEAVPVVAGPARLVRTVHSLASASTFMTIRGVATVVAAVADGALVVAEAMEAAASDERPPTDGPATESSSSS